MNAAVKQWAVKVISPPVGALAVLRDGVPLPTEISPGAATPVEVLLASIGSCFALSCNAVFATRGVQRVAFQVSVTGRKAQQLPSRLISIELEVAFDPSLPSADALAITASAEQLCTVTNTLTSEPPCEIRVDVANKQR